MSISLSNLATANDDRALVEKAKRDRQAFAMLYRRNHGMVANYIFRRTGDRHLTEDLVGEVFLAALRYLPRYRDRGLPIQAWLYRIATNLVNKWVRRERLRIMRRFSELAKDGQIDHVDPASASNESPDNEFTRLAMLSLKPKYQAVLSLHYLEGMSLEEVSAAIGCRLGTVKSRLSRGRDSLREKLLKRGTSHA